MSAKGFFISFEGGEGCGKSTQVRLLGEKLKSSGHDILLTREPGGTPEGENIRNLFTRSDGGDWTPMAECLLLYAARTMHIDKLIRPGIEQGKVVITDRFTDSTRAYQSYGHGLAADIIENLDRLVTGGFAPNVTFILDIDVKKGLGRAKGRLAKDQSGEDRFENLDLSFHERLRQGFIDIARNDPDRCVVIDADRPPEEIADDIERIAIERIADV